MPRRHAVGIIDDDFVQRLRSAVRGGGLNMDHIIDIVGLQQRVHVIGDQFQVVAGCIIGDGLVHGERSCKRLGFGAVFFVFSPGKSGEFQMDVLLFDVLLRDGVLEGGSPAFTRRDRPFVVSAAGFIDERGLDGHLRKGLGADVGGGRFNSKGVIQVKRHITGIEERQRKSHRIRILFFDSGEHREISGEFLFLGFAADGAGALAQPGFIGHGFPDDGPLAEGVRRQFAGPLPFVAAAADGAAVRFLGALHAGGF